MVAGSRDLIKVLVAGSRDLIKQVSKVQRDSVILRGLLCIAHMIQVDHAPMVSIISHHIQMKLRLMLSMFNEDPDIRSQSNVPTVPEAALVPTVPEVPEPPPPLGCSVAPAF